MAPATGYIIARNVSPGQRFDKGFEWYQIANLDKVWILADLFPNDAGNVKPGIKARVTVPGPGQRVPRHGDQGAAAGGPESSRTLKVRLELDNPDHVLRPDMFVNVELPVTRPPALTRPDRRDPRIGAAQDRVRGPRQRLLRAAGGGNRLAARRPGRDHQGARARARQIVISGNFLIDSESKLVARGLRHAGVAGQGPGLRAGDFPAQGGEGRPEGQPRRARPTTSIPKSAGRHSRKSPGAIARRWTAGAPYRSDRRPHPRLRTTRATLTSRLDDHDQPHHRFLRRQQVLRPGADRRRPASPAGGRCGTCRSTRSRT